MATCTAEVGARTTPGGMQALPVAREELQSGAPVSGAPVSGQEVSAILVVEELQATVAEVSRTRWVPFGCEEEVFEVAETLVVSGMATAVNVLGLAAEMVRWGAAAEGPETPNEISSEAVAEVVLGDLDEAQQELGVRVLGLVVGCDLVEKVEGVAGAEIGRGPAEPIAADDAAIFVEELVPYEGAASAVVSRDEADKAAPTSERREQAAEDFGTHLKEFPA